MGAKRGRPKINSKSYNPFDLKLSTRVRNKQCNRRGRGKSNWQNRGDNSKGVLEPPTDNSDKVIVEATEIIDTSLSLGLEVIRGREEGIKVLSKNIERGKI